MQIALGCSCAKTIAKRMSCNYGMLVKAKPSGGSDVRRSSLTTVVGVFGSYPR
jgi:hypothetical protein